MRRGRRRRRKKKSIMMTMMMVVMMVWRWRWYNNVQPSLQTTGRNQDSENRRGYPEPHSRLRLPCTPEADTHCFEGKPGFLLSIKPSKRKESLAEFICGLLSGDEHDGLGTRAHKVIHSLLSTIAKLWFQSRLDCLRSPDEWLKQTVLSWEVGTTMFFLS